MQNKIRKSVPMTIKRALRQGAGFGCCRCGYPFIEYHHIINYSDAEEHNEKDMMIVCSRCHDLFTDGAISVDEQRKLKNNPFNLQNKAVYGELFLKKHPIRVGSTYFRCNGPLIIIDNEPIIQTTHSEDGTLLLSLKLFDSSDNLVVYLKENEWIMRPDDTWDLEAKSRKVIVRQAERNISLKIELIDNEIELTGMFWKNGHLIKAKKSGLEIGTKNLKMSFCTFSNAYIDINTKEKTSTIRLGKGLHPNQAYSLKQFG